MIDIEEFDGGLRVVDGAKNQVEIEIDDWEPGGEELKIGYDVTETLTGSGTEIRLPESGFLIESSELDQPKILNMDEQVKLSAGDHLCRRAATLDVLIRIEDFSALSVEMTNKIITLSFQVPTRFTLGFEEYDYCPREKISVPPTVEGVAGALETCSSRHETETPDRSFPSSRPRAPRIEFDEDVDGNLGEGGKLNNQIHFRLPPSFDYLFPLAPLAFYLGARVTVEKRSEPVLELDSVTHEFHPGSRYSDEIATLLRRVFYLDCLVREAGPRCLGIREFELLDDLPLNPDLVYKSPMPDRVKAYLEVPFETIDSGLPSWPLATYVEPTIDNLPSIPFLIDRLSMVFPPKSSPLDRQTWVKRSLGDFYRSTSSHKDPNRPIEISSPETNRARVQGWIASGNPVDAFKCPPEAFENRRDYFVSSSEPISIRVVLNDEAMDGEHSRVVQIYQNRANELPLELDVLKEVTTEELARSLESHSDFLHYIGHCDPSGFRCADGNLSVEQLSKSRTRTFFLNACGSYTEGLNLICKGSVAGAVTFGDVIDAQAAKVGGDFARLYMYGHTIERALYHARGQAIMNKEYVIVGDGTHVLTQGDTVSPAVTHVHRSSKGTFSVTYECAPVNLNGGVLMPYAGTVPQLMGNQKEIQVDHRKLEEFLSHIDHDPIIYENKFYWPEELLDELF